MIKTYSKLISSIVWNLLLLSVGAVIFSIGVKAFAIPQGLIMGGFSGVGLLAYYFTDMFSPGVWYFLVNIPVILTEGPGGDLPVQDPRRDVREVGRDLSPALCAVFAGDAGETDKFICERLDGPDFHANSALQAVWLNILTIQGFGYLLRSIKPH